MNKPELPVRSRVGAGLLDRIDAVINMGAKGLRHQAQSVANEMLLAGEQALGQWVRARGEEPTDAALEGFHLLALHRQGAKGDPSFNACRETCRELAYHYNCAVLPGASADPGREALLSAMVAKHLVLFIDGKLENAGLGEFCCSSRPLRTDAVATDDNNHS